MTYVTIDDKALKKFIRQELIDILRDILDEMEKKSDE